VQLRSGLARPRLLLREPLLEAPGFYLSPIECTYLAADTGQMARKTEPSIGWAIYKVTTRAVWLGTIEAVYEAAAVEKATEEFKTDARWLCAVRRL
jgi:hypothetical protein